MSRFSALPLALLGMACVDYASPEGEFAIGYGGAKSCGVAEVPEGAFPESLTVEAWVRADTDAAYAVHPLVIWTGGFSLWQDPDGIAYFSDGSAEEIGASHIGGWMDGVLHHVAGTYSEGAAVLFVDGRKVGFNNNVVFGAETGTKISIGCWSGKDHVHQGIIDEVRISEIVRYTDDFDVPNGPFQPDADTMSLWHFDEGEGNLTVDDAGGSDIDLVSTSWVEFSLGDGEDAASE